MDWLSNCPGRQVFLHRDRPAQKGIRITSSVGPLANRNAAKILPRGACVAHIVVSDHGEHGVRPAGAVGVGGITGKLAEVG